MRYITVEVSEEVYQRLRERAQQTGRTIEDVAGEILNAALVNESIATRDEISGSLNIPDLDAIKHNLYPAGLDDDDGDT